jgi:subtilisin family serine protease
VPGLTGVQVVTVPEGDAASAARTLDKSSDVVWAQPVRRMHLAAALPSGSGNQSSDQWGLLNSGQTLYDSDYRAMTAGTAGVDGDFTPAWDTTTGAGQTIAVVDTGVDFTIADLSANRDANGWDFVQSDSDPSPDPSGTTETSHGTHVAGIAAAAMGISQTRDIVGGAPDARIMAVRALDGEGSGYDTDIAAAFDWAAAHGARVVNASLGGAGESDVLHDAIASNPNTLFVVAAGNDGENQNVLSSTQRDYPCADPSPNVVCVAAVNNTGALASFSNYGASYVDVAAPGENIPSYVLGGAVQHWDGTSMATPFVSAAAALAFAQHPGATAAQVAQSILATARPLASLCGRVASGGIVDAAALLSLSTTEPTPHACGPVTLSSGAPKVGTTLSAAGTFDRGTVAWSWQRCAATCTTIAGATAKTYTAQAADVGKRLQATAIATTSGGSSAPVSAMTASAVAAPAPAPTPTPVAPKPVAPAPTPVATPAPALRPLLALHKPRRSGRVLRVSGTVTRAFHGTVTIKVCAGRHCRTVRVRARNGSFAAKLRPPRRGRLVVTVSVAAGGGFTAARAHRTIRF